MAVQQVGDQLVGQLVHRGRAEPVAGGQRLDHGPQMSHRAQAVDVRVAEVDADGVAAVVVGGLGQAVGDQVDASAQPISSQAVSPFASVETRRTGLRSRSDVVHVRDRHALGADVPAREWVGGVAANRGDGAVVDGQFEAADRLTQIADADALLHGPIVSDPVATS